MEFVSVKSRSSYEGTSPARADPGWIDSGRCFRRLVVEQRLEVPQGDRLRPVAHGCGHRLLDAGYADIGALVAGEFQLLQRHEAGRIRLSRDRRRRQNAGEISF